MAQEQPWEQAMAFVRGFSSRQWLLLGAAAVAVLVSLWFFVGLAGQADFRPLYSGLSPAEAQTLAGRLQTRSIRAELSSDGTAVRVPAGDLDRARLELASQGMPRSGRMGFELFDQPNWAGSTFSEKVNYQRALEGELERTIQSIQEVESARVHLVLPQPSLFTEREQPAKAAVVLKLRGAGLGEESAFSIRHLVAGSVEGLAAQNVTIVNADGRQPLPGGGRDARASGEAFSEEKILAGRLLAALAPVVGEEKVRATVTVEYDLSTSESTQETYDPNASVLLSSQVSEEQSGAPAAGGVPGTASNVPPAADPSLLAGADTQVSRMESKTYAVSKSTRVTHEPAGRLRRLAAAVLVDDALEPGAASDAAKQPQPRKRTPEEMQQFEALAKAAIGFDAQRGDQLSIQNLSFQVLPVETPAPPPAGERLLRIGERWLPLLRYAALLVLFLLAYLLMLRPLKKQIVASFQRMPAPALPPAEGAQPALAAHDGLEDEEALLHNLNETSSEVKRAVVLKRHLVEKIKKEPQVAGRLIQTWIRREEAHP